MPKVRTLTVLLGNKPAQEIRAGDTNTDSLMKQLSQVTLRRGPQSTSHPYVLRTSEDLLHLALKKEQAAKDHQTRRKAFKEKGRKKIIQKGKRKEGGGERDKKRERERRKTKGGRKKEGMKVEETDYAARRRLHQLPTNIRRRHMIMKSQTSEAERWSYKASKREKKKGEEKTTLLVLSIASQQINPNLRRISQETFTSWHGFWGSEMQERLSWVVQAWGLSWSCSQTIGWDWWTI